jgi:putative ABC transport system ATP-binding protein
MTTHIPLPILDPTPAEESLAVKIRNLNYFYGQGELRKQVLFDINLDLPKGQIVIMTGPSGSGKTTLLSLIGALRTLQDVTLS